MNRIQFGSGTPAGATYQRYQERNDMKILLLIPAILGLLAVGCGEQAASDKGPAAEPANVRELAGRIRVLVDGPANSEPAPTE